jgi:hypothetical protein
LIDAIPFALRIEEQGARSAVHRVSDGFDRGPKSLGYLRGDYVMRKALTALLCAAPICAFAVPAIAQTADQYGSGPFGPVGAVVAAPFTVAGDVISAPFGWMSGSMTVASNTGTPAYSYGSRVPPALAPNGHCDLIGGNRVCFAGP